MYPEAMGPSAGCAAIIPRLGELIQAGKESYYIVSQFNLFEYEQEAPSLRGSATASSAASWASRWCAKRWARASRSCCRRA
jgi:hypothetical protein